MTVCTDKRRPCFGRVLVGRGDHTPPYVELSPTGKLVEKYICGISDAYENVLVDEYIIMPDHVHLVIAIDPTTESGGVWSPRPTSLLTVIRSFKTMVTKALGRSIWQTSYYDHVIRGEKEYLQILQYISENPARWAEYHLQ